MTTTGSIWTAPISWIACAAPALPCQRRPGHNPPLPRTKRRNVVTDTCGSASLLTAFFALITAIIPYESKNDGLHSSANVLERQDFWGEQSYEHHFTRDHLVG